MFITLSHLLLKLYNVMNTLYTPPWGFIFPGTEAAHAPQTMYPCYDKPRCHFSLTQWNLGAPFGVLPSLN